MVGGQPGSRTPCVREGLLVYSQLQSPMLLAARCNGADDGTRTHDLNAGDVVFYLTELRPQNDYDVRRSH
jgi:hypothetical protein